ncbi:C13 family peptidase [Brevundimonas sp. Root1279]|uniref:C13 family peptidase n=1 Tax=Brevundimonas sp. Root1279 TaxID=1736443 RepID=UPI0009EB0171|nr:C13 family peptidase [Brevundimonas sp. Root1279]
MRRNGIRRTAPLLAAMAALLAGPACAQSPPAPGRFDGWTTAVIAADWRDGRGQPMQAFDNARRDIVRGFQAAGLPRATMTDYSLRPDAPDPVTSAEALQGVAETAARGQSGCLLYFTSHGSPDGIVFGPKETISPAAMANLVRRWCGSRPTVVIVSACYSGVFINALAASNRMILTAASRERTSFGCGAEETYPWFDGCVLEALPTARDFLALAAGARACVARREQEAGITLSSDPQLYVGADMQMRLPTLRFERSGS